jgi:hypothetical protein
LIIGPFKRKILRITAYTLGSLIALLVGFHFWFINHAERLLEDLVESQSNGKVKLHVKKFKFNWFSYDMQLRNAVFYSTDSTANTSYLFNVEKIHVRVKEIFPLIFEKKMVFDSLHLLNPDIQVTKLRLKVTDTTRDKNVSLTQEMGRVYNSIQDALRVLKVKQFVIEHGKFTLANKTQPDELPVTITNINLHLDNLRVDTSEEISGKQKIFFSDNIALQTYNQDIFFPDGRHRISFKSFGINLLKKRVEFDSCTIAASKGDSARSSFKIFFDKLQLTNIDFDTLYQKEVIKADSVYCTNPRFRLDAEMASRTGRKKAPLKLNELIQQLTGDMQLAFVVVNNASFDINTIRDGKPNSFTSDHNNFEMQGLRIEKKSEHPLTVKSFAMAIRNYENFLKDSTYAMEFDSVFLINNSIYLNNFSFKQLQGDTVLNSFRMPRFELKGLSWDELIFDRNLAADEATLYHPVINYSVATNNPRNKKQDIFQTLAGIGDIIQLNNLDISNGQINVNFRGGNHLQLEDASMSLLSRQLTESNHINDLQQSVTQLRFKNGLLKLGDITAKIENADFTGKNGQLTAAAMHVTSNKKNLTVNAKGVTINSMLLDNDTHATEINGVQWQEANVEIKGSSPKENIARSFLLKKIQGTNTTLSTLTGGQKLNAFFSTLSADELSLHAGAKIQLVNLHTTGKDFSFIDSNLRLITDHFVFVDRGNSTLENFHLINTTSTDSVSISIPSIGFTTDLNSIINGSVVMDNLDIVRPVILLKKLPKENATTTKRKKLPDISAGKISIREPDLSFGQPGQAGFTKIEWHSKEDKTNSVELRNFKIKNGSSVTVDQLLLSAHAFSFGVGEKTFNAGNGGIKTQIDQFVLKPNDAGEWDWHGKITDLQANNFLLDSLGNRPGQFWITSLRLNNLAISSQAILNIRQLVKENTSFQLKEITGKYDDQKNHFDWSNAGYDHLSKTFTADSFTFHLIQSKEDFVASQKYQEDYLSLRTGSISLGSFDINKYLDDTLLDAGALTINNPVITDFRDKRMPFRAGNIKPLPVNFLKKLPVKLSVGLITINNADVAYTEMNEKTNKSGTVTLKQLNAAISFARNYNYGTGDSLHIQAKALLMDSARIQVSFKESYTDTSARFLLKAGIGPANGKIVNSILVPLASVELESGWLDTLSMVVTGGEYLATGEMKMLYHDLKIKFLNNKGQKRKSVYKGVASFLANIVIKNRNRGNTDAIFFERIRDKSSFNYLVKITLNGISSSIGIKNNAKLLRRYKKELHKRNL